jgi:hypothetical protein
MNTLSPFREYEAPKIETPCGNANEVDLIAATSAMRIWSMKTRHPLDAVLTRGFFDGMIDLRLRRDDRIETDLQLSRQSIRPCNTVGGRS